MGVLVTGGAGFIGSHVVDRLVAAGHGIRVLDALLPSVHATAPELPAGVELVVADVRDAVAVAAALSGWTRFVIGPPWSGLGVDLDDMSAYAGSNDLGTAVLLAEAARAGVRRLVRASSIVVYGEGRYRCARHGDVVPGPWREEAPVAPKVHPHGQVCADECGVLRGDREFVQVGLIAGASFDVRHDLVVLVRRQVLAGPCPPPARCVPWQKASMGRPP